jgi:hypothetical protein
MSEIRERETITFYAILQFEIWNLYEIYYYNVFYVSPRPYFMLNQIMALSIRYLWECIHARRALICQAYTPRVPQASVINSAQLSTARGFRAYFKLTTPEGFSYATTGHHLRRREAGFNFLSISEEEMRRDFTTLHVTFRSWEGDAVIVAVCGSGVRDRDSHSKTCWSRVSIMCPIYP